MSNSKVSSEELIQETLKEMSQGNKEFWSFKGRTQRHYTHNFFQYPAMMVPQMQEVLLNSILSASPKIKRVFDPFAGSGTVMTEAMLCGLDFTAHDINPLAVLLCRTKSGTMDIEQLKEDFREIKSDITSDKETSIEVDFPNLNKWFTDTVIQDLSKIRRAISKVPETWRRRFFWVALAEVVRLTSNSRTSNFKLYMLPVEEIKTRQISATNIFFDVVSRNLRQFNEHRAALTKKNLIIDNSYKGVVDVLLGDSATLAATDDGKSDLLITSPPYGDNVTTVSYGQYSYLPLRWIELADIDDNVSEQYLASTHEIDARSLGGSRSNALQRAERLFDLSPSFKQIIEDLKDLPPDRVKRVASFCSDLEKTLDPILDKLNPASYMVWVVGNRSVGRKEVPMNQILQELLEGRGSKFVIELDRSFPNHTKRMANLTNTMPTEHILVMKKASNQ